MHRPECTACGSDAVRLEIVHDGSWSPHSAARTLYRCLNCKHVMILPTEQERLEAQRAARRSA